MSALHKIRGAGGGGGKSGGGSSHTPTEAPDSLRSRQYAHVLDMVSEGEIEGLVGGLRGIFLDDTPIENSDGSLNFSGVSVDWRPGTQAQAYLPGFPAVESETSVSAEVKYGVPVVRQVSNPNIDAVRVTVSIPQLTYQNPKSGDLGGSSVDIAIDVQDNGGGWQAARLRTENVGMSFSGTTASSGGADILSATIGVAWSGIASGSAVQQMAWTAQYRAYGSSDPWTTFGSGTLSGAPYTVADPSYWTNGEGGYYKTMQDDGTYNVPVSYEEYLAATTAIAAPGGSAAATFTAPVEGAYEFRVTGTGTGSIAIASATAFMWTGTDTITGKTTSRYQRAYRVPLAGTGPWDIRVRRLTADSTSQTLQNKTWWESYTEIIDAKLRYPNSALVGVSVDSSQFRSIPRRGYLIKGLRVRVPSNYNPVTRSYTGVWDGTFQVAWTDNPAWCFYDLVTANRYGLGDFIDATQVDKWALYDIAQYCDEMVPNGFGGEEPRFTCNLYLQTREEAYNVISTMASIFRGMAWWTSGAITVSADKPEDPVMLFTAANVIGGAFSYTGASLKARHTVALVSWNDPADHYRQKIQYVEDETGIALYGVIKTEVLAAGCTSRGQAHRFGRWMLYSERLETETVTFKCGMDGTYLAPGDVIQTQDAARAGKRFGGRLVSATTTALTLDAAVTIESGKAYTLSAILPDGTLETRAVTTGAGSQTVLAVSPAFTSAPQVGAIWVLAATDLVPESWRVLGIAEGEPGILEVTALAHRPDKYAAVEQNLLLEPLQSSSVSATPAAPTGLVLSESLYQTGAEVRTQVVASWDSVAGIVWDVSWRRGDNNWLLLPRVEVANITIADVQPGLVEVRVIARNAIGARSPGVSATLDVLGKTAPPAAVTGFSILKVSGLGLAQWDLHPDLDVRVDGQIVIRHSPATTGAEWRDGIIVDTFDGNATTGSVALMTGTYMVKALDSSGNWSAAEASFVATEGMVTGWTTVGSSIQHPTFSGTKTNTIVTGSALQLDAAVLWDALPGNVDDFGVIDALGGAQASGTYDFAAALDLSTVATRRFEADIDAVAFDTGDFIDARTGDIDLWSDIDGTSVNDCDATLFISVTNDNPSGSPAWGPWQPFLVSDFTCRAARFQLLLEAGEVTHNIAVSTLRVDAKVPA